MSNDVCTALGLKAAQIQHKSIEHLGPWANNPSPSNASSTSRETRVGGRYVVLSSIPQKPPRTDHENKLHHLEASYPYTAKLTRSSPNFSIQQMKKKLPHAMQTDPQIRSSVSRDCFFTPRSCHPILRGRIRFIARASSDRHFEHMYDRRSNGMRVFEWGLARSCEGRPSMHGFEQAVAARYTV